MPSACPNCGMPNRIHLSAPVCMQFLMHAIASFARDCITARASLLTTMAPGGFKTYLATLRLYTPRVVCYPACSNAHNRSTAALYASYRCLGSNLVLAAVSPSMLSVQRAGRSLPRGLDRNAQYVKQPGTSRQNRRVRHNVSWRYTTDKRGFWTKWMRGKASCHPVAVERHRCGTIAGVLHHYMIPYAAKRGQLAAAMVA